jgi:hypothetical protein
MSTNSRIKATYPKHFDPNPEAIWDNIDAIEKRAQKADDEDEPDESNDEFDIYDLSNEDE